MSVKIEQTPRELVRKNRQNFMCAQVASISLPDFVAASEVYVSEEPVVLPLQKCVRDHRQEQLPYINYVTAILLMMLLI